jgi:hypothetical protein
MIMSKEPPYKDTEVAYERTMSEIQKMLLEYGCEAVQVTTTKDGFVTVKFTIEVEIEGVRKGFGVSITPPILLTRKTQGGRRIEVKDTNRSARLLYWYIKSKLEAVSYGLVSAEQEFFSDIIVRLPGGREKKVGDLAKDILTKGDLPLLGGGEG